MPAPRRIVRLASLAARVPWAWRCDRERARPVAVRDHERWIMQTIRDRMRVTTGQGRRRGQGTVEYLGLVLAVGALLLAVSVQVKGGGAGIGGQISKSMEKAIAAVAQP